MEQAGNNLPKFFERFVFSFVYRNRRLIVIDFVTL
jgi:hypothetical protein